MKHCLNAIFPTEILQRKLSKSSSDIINSNVASTALVEVEKKLGRQPGPKHQHPPVLTSQASEQMVERLAIPGGGRANKGSCVISAIAEPSN